MEHRSNVSMKTKQRDACYLCEFNQHSLITNQFLNVSRSFIKLLLSDVFLKLINYISFQILIVKETVNFKFHEYDWFYLLN